MIVRLCNLILDLDYFTVYRRSVKQYSSPMQVSKMKISSLTVCLYYPDIGLNIYYMC